MARNFLKSKRRVWNLYQQAKTWHSKPSDLIDLDAGPWQTHDFNTAVWTLGSWVESELDKVKLPRTAASREDAPRQLARRRQRLLETILSEKKRRTASIDDLRALGAQVVSASASQGTA